MRKTRFSYFIFFLWLIVAGYYPVQAQDKKFTRQDTLRGSVTPEREWWDLTYYHLDIRVDPEEKSITGSNTIHYKVLKSSQIMQIDLQAPMEATAFVQEGKELEFDREGNVYFVQLQQAQAEQTINAIQVQFGGKPVVSINPPWSGGITWSKDKDGNHWIANSNQGDGASLWWPCKDHMYDEPDSMLISVTVPEGLKNISNGQLREVEEKPNGENTFHWYVDNPINNYGVNISIGNYVHFGDTYLGEKGPLSMDYYVLPYNLEKAKSQFKDALRMMRAFEYWFGPYPFYEDGYKLIEVPYLGMEHQSAVTYGNDYLQGYKGKDLSGTGWGLLFDFIIIHESGHEWFANNITYKDIADMWIHEGFTNYSESLFLDYHYGKLAGNEYVIGTRSGILNDKPIIGIYNVNQRGSSDMYNKGGNILHTLRQIINEDEKWRRMLWKINREFYHRTVTTKEIEDFLSRESEMDLSLFFDQYLRTTKIPVFQYRIQDNTLHYKWENTVEGFSMPLKIKIDGQEKWLDVNSEWQMEKVEGKIEKINADPNFYIETKITE